MDELWYRKIGFQSNPFSIKPAAFNNELIAYDMSFIHKKIEKGELIFIEGEYGTGKTTILKNVISHFKGKNKIIYYSFNDGRKFNLKSLINGANSLLRKVTGLKIKDMILLLDEVHTMNKSDVQKIMSYYRDGTLKSVVFVTHDYSLVHFPDEVESLLDGNIIQTVNLSIPEAVALVKKRISGVDLLSDTMIAKLFNLSKKNPRRLLSYCEDVSRYAVEMGDYKVTDQHIKEVLGDVAKTKKKAKPAKKRSKKKSSQKKQSKQAKHKTEKQEKISEIETKTKPEPIQVKKEKKSSEPVIEIEDKDDNSKKYKVNKLVVDSRSNPLGTVSEKETEDEETPEYNFFVYDY
jgi:energy-coupling factor transporter ATP-binding protein EcfA2